VDTPFRQYGIPQEFLDHAKRDAILERIGLTAQALARGIVEDVTALDADDRPDHAPHDAGRPAETQPVESRPVETRADRGAGD
jgi:1-deoxy-D-xylulose-5-phosphate synthase